MINNKYKKVLLYSMALIPILYNTATPSSVEAQERVDIQDTVYLGNVIMDGEKREVEKKLPPITIDNLDGRGFTVSIQAGKFKNNSNTLEKTTMVVDTSSTRIDEYGTLIQGTANNQEIINSNQPVQIYSVDEGYTVPTIRLDHARQLVKANIDTSELKNTGPYSSDMTVSVAPNMVDPVAIINAKSVANVNGEQVAKIRNSYSKNGKNYPELWVSFEEKNGEIYLGTARISKDGKENPLELISNDAGDFVMPHTINGKKVVGVSLDSSAKPKSTLALNRFSGKFRATPYLKDMAPYFLAQSNFSEGDLVIPSGVSKLGDFALQNSKFQSRFIVEGPLVEEGLSAPIGFAQHSNFRGEFPAPIKDIGGMAFQNSKFSGDIRFHKDFKKVEPMAFQNSVFTNHNLVIPFSGNISAMPPNERPALHPESFAKSKFTGEYRGHPDIELKTRVFGDGTKFSGKITQSTVVRDGSNFKNSRFTELEILEVPNTWGYQHRPNNTPAPFGENSLFIKIEDKRRNKTTIMPGWIKKKTKDGFLYHSGGDYTYTP